VGWHRFGLLLRSDSSVTFFVDDQQVGTITGQFANANPRVPQLGSRIVHESGQ
jgi:hypothetical protein